MTSQGTIKQLYDAVGTRLKLRWITENGGHNPLRGDFPGASHQTMVGPLNCIHPNRIQIIGHAELVFLTDMGKNSYRDTVDKLFSCRPAAILFSDNIEASLDFIERARESRIPLLASSLDDNQLINNLQYYLARALAERSTVHGVFMEVFGLGVLLSGEAAVGKSELALDLICRGHRLVADDAPEFAQVAPDSLTGSCPPLLQDFLEVRGLGILNIRQMFGDSSISLKRELHIIIQLKKLSDQELAVMERLDGSQSTRTLFGVSVPEITIPVAPGRNLAILVEAAARSHALRDRGYNANEDFIERQRRLIGGES